MISLWSDLDFLTIPRTSLTSLDYRRTYLKLSSSNWVWLQGETPIKNSHHLVCLKLLQRPETGCRVLKRQGLLPLYGGDGMSKFTMCRLRCTKGSENLVNPNFQLRFWGCGNEKLENENMKPQFKVSSDVCPWLDCAYLMFFAMNQLVPT